MSFVEQIRLSLLERDEREKAQSDLMEHCRRLVQQMVVLKERNAALLKAASSSGGSVGASRSSGGGSTLGNSSGAPDNPVRAAFLASLETQLATTRLELSEQYKIQSSNSQRLLLLTDTLREAEDRSRDERDELRKLRGEVEALRDRARWHKEVVSEKEKQLIILQDDHASLELELSQVTIQNENLKIDNSSLLQRWIESKNEEAARMNEANTWVQEASKQKSSRKASLSGSEVGRSEQKVGSVKGKEKEKEKV